MWGEVFKGDYAMPPFNSELAHISGVPFEYSTPAMKARLAECILKAAAQGHTTYNELVTAGADQIQAILSILT
jgi:hypothetical protein